MNILHIVLLTAACLLVAYRLYGRLLSRLLRLDPNATTPAVAYRDDVDFAPIEPQFLLSQHFSAIAAAGPIIGPILAGAMFGWLPALLWIVVGAIFIGGVHDLTALTASIRHKARSIAEVVREHMSRRSYVLFLAFIWIALVYIIIAFTDITAASFLGAMKLENGQGVSGGGIATSSLLYLVLPILMALAMRFGRLTIGWATLIFLPLVGLAIWVGQYIPLDLERLLNRDRADAQRVWCVLLLAYCFAASVVPMWLLLQPRGHLGGWFLYLALFGGAAGLVLGHEPIQFPAFRGWVTAAGEPLFPVLFITIACGACSGFHAMIASGTSSKQLRRETDATLIGYGAMLMEAMVSVVSLACVMVLAVDSPLLKNPQPNLLYANGIGQFLHVLGIPTEFGVAFGLMAFTTFVYDTLDVCTRLGRYVVQELTHWHTWGGRVFSTALTAGVPLYFLLTLQSGEGVAPAWKQFWPLFGASNQLLAALTLLGILVWLWRTQRAAWVWPVVGLPALCMYTFSVWQLLRFVAIPNQQHPYRDPILAGILVSLAVLILIEALWIFFGRPPSRDEPDLPAEAASLRAG